MKEEEKEYHKFILDEDGIPWEIGAGFLKLAGAAEPLSDDARARLTRTILSGASDISEEEALRIRAKINAELKEK